MSWTPQNYTTLKAWRDANLTTVGELSDHAAAELYNAETTAGPTRAITPEQFFSGLEASEVAQIQDQALDDRAAAHVPAAALSYWFDQVGTVDLTEGTAPRGYVDWLVTAGVISAVSLARLITAAATTIPRWQADGCARPANHGDIAWVKREMN